MYVDAWEDKEHELVRIVERVNGERVYKEYKYDHTFYYRDPQGQFKDIYGNSVAQIVPGSHLEKEKNIKMMSNHGICESDFRPSLRCLEQEYLNAQMPKLNVAFWDIETDFDKVAGYCTASDATNPIISIAVYLQWQQRMVCIAVPPKTMRRSKAEEIAQRVGNTIIVDTEKEMLSMFIALVQDADVLSGWNSESYDITFTINRIIRLLGKAETRKLCLWNQLPKKKTVKRGTGTADTYTLIGRIHLDYMQLYMKYNYEERHSYKLNAIAEAELGEKKVDYDGTLDQLYNLDFEKFLEYNIQDTMLLDRLDKKLGFIDLASNIAHANVVPIPTTMGAVAVTEQAIVVEAHSKGVVVPNRKNNDHIDTRAAGGWVAHPKKGLHKWLGSVDLNSLYPSVLRAFNMSPETIVGQLRYDRTTKALVQFEEATASNTFAKWWNDRFNTLEMQFVLDNDTSEILHLDMEDGSSYEVTGAEVRKLIFESGQPWMISANGTIFRTDIEGIIPSLLKRWYSERKQLQKIMREYNVLEDSEKNDKALYIPEAMRAQIKETKVATLDPHIQDTAFSIIAFNKMLEGDIGELNDWLSKHQLKVKDDGMVIHKDQELLKKIVAFWEKRQLVKKINLNSLYGGLLNAYCRFFDQRLGQSTTLSGRSITRHMAAKTNEIITGEYDHQGKCVIYGDTDSAYFSAYPEIEAEVKSGKVKWTKDSVIELYDTIAEQMNETFPEFLLNDFNVPLDRSTGVIAAGREVIASSGLFIKKKRYAALVYDDEGKRKDVGGKEGKIKVIGLDLRRADCPVFVQKFLMGILFDLLSGKQEEEIILKIREFKLEFEALKPWDKGVPKAVNGMTRYAERMLQEEVLRKTGNGTKGFTVPGHVTGSMNWNMLRQINNDLHTLPIVDTQKIVLCYLKETADNRFKSISYPIDEPHLPKWFTSLPFDDDLMLEKIVDQKIGNLLNVLKWDLTRTSRDAAHAETLFDFDAWK